MTHKMNNIERLVIFSGNLDFYVRWNIISLVNEYPHARVTILLHSPSKNIGQIFRNQFKNLNRHGWRWIPYLVSEILNIFASKIRRTGTTRSIDLPGQAFTRQALNDHPRILVKHFNDINNTESQEFLRGLSPELGIALAAPILKKELFTIPRLGTINLHKGRLPDYRGMPPAFWELKNNESEIGCTVHKVDAGLDSGDILLETTLPVHQYSTVRGMQMRLHRLGIGMVCEAVALILNKTSTPKSQLSGGRIYRRPALSEEKRLVKRLKSKEPAHSPLKTFLKELFFSLYVYGYAPLDNLCRRLLGKQRIIILLYHRVSDEFRDNVTTGIERFDEHMAYVAENCTVVSLREIVEGKVPQHSKKPVVAVSFDDGYLDNFENAAPILLKHQVPCTFFVSTDKISYNKPFEHDLKSLGFGLDNMNWQQIRTMRDWGFQFGSHTMNHVNLAKINSEEALIELTGSLNIIRETLNQKQVYIAYPFGGKDHITKSRIEMIREVGYQACFSGYGGLNDENLDLFNIKRIGINWGFSMLAFKARLKGALLNFEWVKRHAG